MEMPAALEAGAEVQITRGFISMITMRPFSGLTLNWDVLAASLHVEDTTDDR
jgi:hypothetical protein